MTRAGIATLITALLLALTACQDDPAPQAKPDPTASSSTSTSPSGDDPSPSMSPVEAVRAWVKARNITVRTGDATKVYELSSKGCTTCDNSIVSVTDIYDKGGKYETVGWRVLRARQDPNFQQNKSVQTAVEYAAGRTWPSKGAKPIEYQSETEIITFRLIKEGGRWLIDALIYLS